MNVLEKIVIPKTNVTMGYIKNELEEHAREEFFRLKKVLAIKRKLKEDKEEKRPVDDKPKKRKPKITPPEEIEKGKCIICGGAIEVTEEDKEAQAAKLEELRAQINEIMNMTKGLNQEGILRTSVNEFLRTAEELKEKLDAEDSLDFEQISVDLNIEDMCEECRIKYLEQHKKKAEEEELEKTADELPETEAVPSSDVAVTIKEPSKNSNKEPSKDTIKSAKTPESVTPEYSRIQSDIQLGTFETEEQEIIKIKRVRNEDGTYSERKKVIKIKREVKTPVRAKSTVSGASQHQSEASGKPGRSDSKTIGMVELNTENVFKNKFNTKLRSFSISTSRSLEPLPRFCMSSVTLLTTDSISDQLMSFESSSSIIITPIHSRMISKETYVKSAPFISEEELLLQIKDRPCKIDLRKSLDKIIKPRYKIRKSKSYFY